ncbi:tetratricopeptide repeat protein [Alloacidobacterium dinghuense]|uniref:Tetratricopeptide repeat protein n=1 Tax=Alloacidobacterium dinghuense TaxID=2763107 RepID=A0A7G8BHE9_9BACT|nr:tetratricopeptide repeat protein [Alloacidobacterium dinghuense]QNI31969.1 tetratricopeptide repeat protein [Alloacidobacterium dinghuense]
MSRQLDQSFLLERQGKFDKAIQILQSLVDSGISTGPDLGKAWTLLGLAYKEQGQFQQAQHAYEQGLHIFEGDEQHTADYASTLEYFAALYRAMRQEQNAIKMGLKAAAIDAQRCDYAGLTRIYTDIAGAAIQQHNKKTAKVYLQKAITESKLAVGLTDDDSAALDSTEALFASTNGKTQEAVTKYGQALGLWKSLHGEQHLFTGWGYVLLGQALATNGQSQDGLVNLQRGLNILEQTVGDQNPKYLVGEILYAKVLDQSGRHSEALQLRGQAEQSLEGLLNRQCTNCTVSVATLLQK